MGATGSQLQVPTDAACHGWGCWWIPKPVWMDSAGTPTVGQLATHVQELSCL